MIEYCGCGARPPEHPNYDCERCNWIVKVDELQQEMDELRSELNRRSMETAREGIYVNELLAACRGMIEAMKQYQCSVDDPPTEAHRNLMRQAIVAVDRAEAR